MTQMMAQAQLSHGFMRQQGSSFSIEDFFTGLVGDSLPQIVDDDLDGTNLGGGINSGDGGRDAGGALRIAVGGGESISSPTTAGAGPAFAEVESLIPLFKNARNRLVDMDRQVDSRLSKLKQEVDRRDAFHRETLSLLGKGVEGLFESFRRLDARISGVGHTAARIGDHLQSADAQRETAKHTIELIQYLMEFNESANDLTDLSPLFTDDARVAEAAAVAQQLRAFAEHDTATAGVTVKGAVTAGVGLEVAAANLQEYCNELENRLLDRFAEAARNRDLKTMAECGKILSQFNRGSSAMQRYVTSRPMFLDPAVRTADAMLALSDINMWGVRVPTPEGGSEAEKKGSRGSLSGSSVDGESKKAGNRSGLTTPAETDKRMRRGSLTGGTIMPTLPCNGLGQLYADIIETVKMEAKTIKAVFPSPNAVMALLVQRVLEERVAAVIDRILVKPSLANPPPVEQGGLLTYLRTLAAAYDKSIALAKELQSLGCGDLDAVGIVDTLFSEHREQFPIVEQASLDLLFHTKLEEVKSAVGESSPAEGGAKVKAAAYTPMLAGVVTEFVRWNEEAVARCMLITPQPMHLAHNVKTVFSCLLRQVSQYTTDGLQRAQDALNEAGALRERFTIGTSVSRRVAAAAAAAAEAAAAAGESSVRGFLVAVQRATTNVAMLQQHFLSTIARLLLPVEGAHAACCEEMASGMSRAEERALSGLRLCLDTVLAEVERVLNAEQKVSEFRPTEDGNPPDHRPTPACARCFIRRMFVDVVVDVVCMLQGLRLFRTLLSHLLKFTFNPSGGLRVKRDISEYASFVHGFKCPAVDEKFETLQVLANVFIVAPDSLPTLVDGSLRGMGRKSVQRFIQLREDYKTSKIASLFPSTSD
ncbi:hypothetical protein CBR_g38471 [Chara braunii]|uniref:Exocyst complex component Sec10 n=1 Tax=Chara braunii TaxID=69332 RepID=A0A388JNP9_CHABU|nr:hypothetical protein CBR_g38471 [Chara braunii]|eukprot:GBG59446.1 hypothetical protein CBR_g38471 [Chara braunii]